jgi:hypothetical protein
MNHWHARSGERLDIAVPPKYKPTDFVKTSYWSQRGKLDVPKGAVHLPPGDESGPGMTPCCWAGPAGIRRNRPRRRGRRHGFTGLLAGAVCAVLTGARSYVAIGEWIADAGLAQRAKLGLSRLMPRI